MREVAFVQQHSDEWKRFESLLQDDDPDPDELADLYVQVMDDLAVARTHFPESKTARYLNQLATKIHQSIYQQRTEDRGRLLRFWTREVPEALYGARTELLVSAVVFLLAVAVGALSAAQDDTFVRLILGDSYVNQTLANVERGEPMAVYRSMHQADMFLGIAFNNVRVSFFAFAMGLLASVGTGYVLLQNGIMLGSFHYMFYEQGLLAESLRVVYIHGTLEISAIVVAGAAGFVLGNGMLFPGTYTRRESFVRGARRGAKIVVGLVPIFLLAALFEGFLTRQTDMPVAASGLIIGGSLAFVLWYFVYYPARLARSADAAPTPADDGDLSVADLTVRAPSAA